MTVPLTSQPVTALDWRMRLVLSMLMAFAAISTDLYLPALPQVAAELHADPGAVQLTIAAYLFGFSFGQLLWGPVGDRYGRRLPIAAGIVIFILGAAGCALSTSVSQLLVWRVVQAVGACAGVVLARAIVRDLYTRDRAAQMLSRLLMVMLIAPLLGPVIGGQILLLAGWRAIFFALVVVGVVTLAALPILPETLPPDQRSTEPLGAAFARYAGLLQHRTLMLYAGAISFLYCGTFAYISASPFAYIEYYHVRPEYYGVLFGIGVFGIMLSNIANARLVLRLGSDRLMRRGITIAAIAGVTLAITASTGWGGLAGLVVPMFFYTAMSGFIVANAVAGAMAHYQHRAATVSALLGAIQFGGGIVGAAVAAALANGTPAPMAWVIAAAGLGSAACAWSLGHAR